MLKFEKIRTDEEFDAAMERIDEIFHAPVGSADGDELEVLVGLVEAWEGGCAGAFVEQCDDQP